MEWTGLGSETWGRLLRKRGWGAGGNSFGHGCLVVLSDEIMFTETGRFCFFLFFSISPPFFFFFSHNAWRLTDLYPRPSHHDDQYLIAPS